MEDEAMRQFRAIPIDWLLSSDVYHKFLIWVSAKSTFNGWGRCDALQVTFTSREAAQALGVSHTTVVRWVAKAREAGLLLPTNSFDREQGKGEVYNLGGDMLATVTKNEFQGCSKPEPTTHQASVVDANTSEQLGTNDAPSADQERSVNRSTPDTPDTHKKKRSSASKVVCCPTEYTEDLQSIIDNWPSKTMYRNGAGAWEPARVTKLHTPDHLWERMVKFCPGEDTTLLINCAISYLNTLFERDKVDGKITNVCAMTNFYGEKAIWKRFVGDAQEEQ